MCTHLQRVRMRLHSSFISRLSSNPPCSEPLSNAPRQCIYQVTFVSPLHSPALGHAYIRSPNPGPCLHPHVARGLFAPPQPELYMPPTPLEAIPTLGPCLTLLYSTDLPNPAPHPRSVPVPPKSAPSLPPLPFGACHTPFPTFGATLATTRRPGAA
jgi:hypothetical protein